MKNERILLIGGVSLVRGRVRNAGAIMVEVCNEIEPLLRDISYSDSAPFKTISLILRFGTNNNLMPEYGPINKKHSELPVSVELEMDVLRRMSEDNIKQEFMDVTLSVLLDVAQRFGLPGEPLAVKRAENKGAY